MNDPAETLKKWDGWQGDNGLSTKVSVVQGQDGKTAFFTVRKQGRSEQYRFAVKVCEPERLDAQVGEWVSHATNCFNAY